MCIRDRFEAASKRISDNTVLAESLEELREILDPVTAEGGGGKFVMAHLADDPACDAAVKQFRASIRCLPLEDHHGGGGRCIVTGKPVDRRAVVAKAY